MENKYKLKLCDFYMKGKCNKQDECTYAHGEKELLCVFDENCVNDKCGRIHINRDENINDNIYIKDKENKESLKKVDIFDEKEFPIFNNNINSKKDIPDTNNITYDLKKILNIKDEYKNKKEILNNESKYIEKEKEKLEFNIQKIDNNINENIENEAEDFKSPEITLTIKENDNQNLYNNENIEIINKMYNEILKLNMDIKQNIKKNIKNDYFKIILINDLNKIESNIKIFKDNYEDCLK